MRHPAIDELNALRRGELPKEQVLEIIQHLGQCDVCTDEDGAAELHPSVDEELFGYVDGTLDPERRAAVAAHLLHCVVCRQDVADARAERKRVRVASPWTFVLPAAAALLLAILGARYFIGRQGASLPPSTPRVTVTRAPIDYGRPDWNALVTSVLGGAPVQVSPLVDEVKPRRDVLRGNGQAHAAELSMQPNGVLVESQQPAFSWHGPESASYVVRVAADGVVIHSPPLERQSWVPGQPLARDVTYTWQVELRPSGRIIPPAPGVPPMFRIVDAASESELELARRQFPNDDLLLGLLSARAGLVDEARGHLRTWTARHPGDPRAQAIAARIP